MSKMNKRGDITITILVIEIVIICGLTILSFFTSNSFVKPGFLTVSTVEEASLIKEKVSSYQNLGYEKEEIKKILGLQEDSQGLVVIKQTEPILGRYDITVRFAWPE